MAKEGIKKTLEEIPIPFRDLKNVVEELRFEDEPTRLRCRGWLVLKSKQFLRANIIFPGSDIDCRLSIRARSGNIVLVPAVFSMFFFHICLGARFITMQYLVLENKIPWIRSWGEGGGRRRDPM